MKFLLATSLILTITVKAEGGDPVCLLENGNVNGDQSFDISDAVFSLSYLFTGGPAPEPQFVSDTECMSDLREELAASQALLAEAQGTVITCTADLSTRDAELAATNAELVNAQSALADAQKSLADREAELAACRAALSACQTSPGLPATGQAKCYDNVGHEIDCMSIDFPGQDGFYHAGCPTEGRFMDNGDGTVTDACTGLMWQKNPVDANENGSLDADDQLPWQDALKYCEGLDLAGHSDWRLPNVRELQGIINYGSVFPSIDSVFSPVTDLYWSSSTFLYSPGYAWVVGFQGGNAFNYVGHLVSKDSRSWIRAVRGGL